MVCQNQPGIGTQTDFEGQFKLNISEGVDSLVVSYIGYKTQIVAVQSNLSVRMRTSANSMEEIVVKSYRTASTEFATERMTALDIYLNPASKADPLLAVDALPASTNTEETANVSLRGSPAWETGVFLNNVPLDDVVRFDQIDGVGQFSIFNTAMLSQLQLYPSNPPIEFGQSTSGIVALYTKDDVPTRQNQLSANLVGMSGLLSRPLSTQTGFTAYANFNSDQGIRRLNPNAFPNLEKFRSFDGGLHLIHRFTPATHLQVFNFSLIENYLYRVQDGGYTTTFDQQKARNLTVANLVHKRKNSRWEWNQSWNISDSEYQFGNIAVQPWNVNTFQGLQGTVFDKDWSLKGGITTRWGVYRAQGTYPLIDYAIQDVHPVQSFTSKEQIFLPETFLYGKYQLTDRLLVGSGVRYLFPAEGQSGFLAAQASLNFQIDSKQQLNLAGGRYGKFFTPDVASPHSFTSSHQLAVDYQFQHQQWTLQAAAYAKWNESGSIFNTIYGSELGILYRGNRLVVQASIASIHSELEENNLEYPSPYDLNYFIRATVQYDIPNWFIFGLTSRQRPGRYMLPVASTQFDNELNIHQPFLVSPDEGIRLPNYTRFDLSLSRLIPVEFGSLLVYASCNNLLDHRNVSRLVYNFDYTVPSEEYFSRRVIFFGVVMQW